MGSRRRRGGTERSLKYLPNASSRGMPKVVVRSQQALLHSCATVETHYPLGEAAGRSEEAGGIQTGGRLPCLHEVHEDLEHLGGIDDDGDELHGVACRTSLPNSASLSCAAFARSDVLICQAGVLLPGALSRFSHDSDGAGSSRNTSAESMTLSPLTAALMMDR